MPRPSRIITNKPIPLFTIARTLPWIPSQDGAQDASNYRQHVRKKDYLVISGRAEFHEPQSSRTISMMLKK